MSLIHKNLVAKPEPKILVLRVVRGVLSRIKTHIRDFRMKVNLFDSSADMGGHP